MRRLVADLALPPGVDNWASVSALLVLDLATSNSGAAFFSDERHLPIVHGLDSQGQPQDYVVPQALHSPIGWALDRRVHAVFAWVYGMCAQLPIDVVVTESHPYAQGMKRRQESVDALAMVRGAAMAASREFGIPCVSFPANHVKLALCNSSTASKDQVLAALVQQDFVVPKNKQGRCDDNVADAIALGCVVSRLVRYERLAQQAHNGGRES